MFFSLYTLGLYRGTMDKRRRNKSPGKFLRLCFAMTFLEAGVSASTQTYDSSLQDVVPSFQICLFGQYAWSRSV